MSEQTPQESLSGSEAVNLASEQSKATAPRNIPSLGEHLGQLPGAEDTANLRFGPSLHDALLGLLPLVGVWRGEGQANVNGKEFSFEQQLIFSHDGGEQLIYESRIWRSQQDENISTEQRESGFWQINSKDEIQVVLANSAGAIEILYGQPRNERSWELESASTMIGEQHRGTYGPGKRLYGLLPNNDLGWVDERLVDGTLIPYLSAQLRRIAG